MPIFEHVCQQLDCDRNALVVEGFFRNSDPLPICISCGTTMNRLISSFQVVFTGPITARYNDRKLEGAHKEGHWLWCKNTPDGKPHREWVDTWEKRKMLMKQEGLEEGGPLSVSSDGKRATGAGMPGCW